MIDQICHPTLDRLPPIPRYDDKILDPWTWEVFHPYLTTGAPEFGVEGRHIPESTLRHFRVGYAENYGKDGSERIIIPLWWQKNLVGWQARHIGPTQESDKYRNSPDFPREQTLYNQPDPIIMPVVVESPMSVLRHWHHVPAMTSTFGATVMEAQIRLLHHYPSALLWFDNDTAGWKATRQVGAALEPYLQVWVAQSGWAADPADLPDDLVDSIISDPVPFALWEPPQTLHPWKG
jgi:DNA primase